MRMAHPNPFAVSNSASINLRGSRVRVQRSLLCSDIIGFTAMRSRRGDANALQIVRRHDAIVRGSAAAAC